MDAYEKSALAYDLIQQSRGRDYSAQATTLTCIIRNLQPDARSLLDVACGTGLHLSFLRESFDVAGLDVSPAMIERARRIVPDVPIELGDMCSFDLGRRFDAITCLFSSIGYLLSIEDVNRAIANMVSHLNPAGVLIVEPWLQPADWRTDYRVAEATNSDGVSVSRVSVNGLEGHVSSFDLYWTIADSGGVDQFVEPRSTTPTGGPTVARLTSASAFPPATATTTSSTKAAGPSTTTTEPARQPCTDRRPTRNGLRQVRSLRVARSQLTGALELLALLEVLPLELYDVADAIECEPDGVPVDLIEPHHGVDVGPTRARPLPLCALAHVGHVVGPNNEYDLVVLAHSSRREVTAEVNGIEVHH